MKRYVERGEIFPCGYGLAYCDYLTARYVAYPFPINWIVRYARLFWRWIRHPNLFDFEREYLGYSAEMLAIQAKYSKALDDKRKAIAELVALMNRPPIDS